MKKWLRLLLIVVIGIQLYPIDRTNPPVQSDFSGPAEVKEVLKTACYDCHSNETQWPWYSYVAPVSWLVADHVEEARAEFNLSAWDAIGEMRQMKIREEMWEEVEEGEMPLPPYVWLHSEAVLSEAQKKILEEWAEGAEDDDEDDDEYDDDEDEHDDDDKHEGENED